MVTGGSTCDGNGARRNVMSKSVTSCRSSHRTQREETGARSVLKVYRGQDGHVHVVKIQVREGILIRPVTKLCPLEID